MCGFPQVNSSISLYPGVPFRVSCTRAYAGHGGFGFVRHTVSALWELATPMVLELAISDFSLSVRNEGLDFLDGDLGYRFL